MVRLGVRCGFRYVVLRSTKYVERVNTPFSFQFLKTLDVNWKRMKDCCCSIIDCETHWYCFTIQSFSCIEKGLRWCLTNMVFHIQLKVLYS